MVGQDHRVGAHAAAAALRHQPLEVLAAHPPVRQSLEAEPLGPLAEAGDQPVGGVPRPGREQLAQAGVAGQGGGTGLPASQRRQVDPGGGRDQGPAGGAVGNREEGAERRRQTVHRTQPGLGQGRPRGQGGEGETAAPGPRRGPLPPSRAAQKPAANASRPAQANASERGWARTDTAASRSWVSASIPCAAISGRGTLASSSGSTTATRATSASSRNERLKPCGPRRERTAFMVASEPVPAVVGTATSGRAGPR